MALRELKNIYTTITEETTPAGGDYILVWDASTNTMRRMSRTNFLTGLIAGSASWGSITGTLTSQSDLNTALSNKVSTTRLISPGTGLTGGGDLTTDRTISLNINGLTDEPTVAAGDYIAIYDVSASATRKMTRANFVAGISGGSGMAISDPVTTGSSGSILFVDSSGDLAQDNSRLNYDASTGTLKLIDKTYIPFAGSLNADVLFSVSSNDNVQNNIGLVSTSNHFVGVANDLKIEAIGANKWYVGQLTSFRVTGTTYSGSPQMVGHWVQLNNRTNLVATPYMRGIESSVSVEGHATEAVGIQASVFKGSAVTCDTVIGARFTGANGYTNATTATGVESIMRTVSGGATVTNGRSILARIWTASGHAVNYAYGVSVSNWTNGGVMENTAGLYIDTSVDDGTITKYAIKSEATSPSYFVGKIGVGSGNTAPTAALQARDIGEPLRLEYDATNYATFQISPTGDMTVNPSGNYFNSTKPIRVASDTYNPAWEFSLEVPNKSDIFEKVDRFDSIDRQVTFFNDCNYSAGIEQDIEVTATVAGMISTPTTHTYTGFGFLNINMSTNAAAKLYIAHNNQTSTSTEAFRLSTGKATVIYRGAIETLSDGTNTYTMRVGFINLNQAAPTNGCFFRYTDSVNSGKWEAVTVDNGTETAQDTGITAVTGAMQKFKVEVNGAGTEVKFYYNGTLTNTITTNIPTANNRLVGEGMTWIRSAGTANIIALTVDYLWSRYEFTTVR